MDKEFNKPRKINSPLIDKILDGITPEEHARTRAHMEWQTNVEDAINAYISNNGLDKDIFFKELNIEYPVNNTFVRKIKEIEELNHLEEYDESLLK